jgi:hypothetical protein
LGGAEQGGLRGKGGRDRHRRASACKQRCAKSAGRQMGFCVQTHASLLRLGEPAASSIDMGGAPHGGKSLYLPSTQGGEGMTARTFALAAESGVTWPAVREGLGMKRSLEVRLKW